MADTGNKKMLNKTKKRQRETSKLSYVNLDSLLREEEKYDAEWQAKQQARTIPFYQSPLPPCLPPYNQYHQNDSSYNQYDSSNQFSNADLQRPEDRNRSYALDGSAVSEMFGEHRLALREAEYPIHDRMGASYNTLTDVDPIDNLNDDDEYMDISHYQLPSTFTTTSCTKTNMSSTPPPFPPFSTKQSPLKQYTSFTLPPPPPSITPIPLTTQQRSSLPLAFSLPIPQASPFPQASVSAHTTTTCPPLPPKLFLQSQQQQQQQQQQPTFVPLVGPSRQIPGYPDHRRSPPNRITTTTEQQTKEITFPHNRPVHPIPPIPTTTTTFQSPPFIQSRPFYGNPQLEMPLNNNQQQKRNRRMFQPQHIIACGFDIGSVRCAYCIAGGLEKNISTTLSVLYGEVFDLETDGQNERTLIDSICNTLQARPFLLDARIDVFVFEKQGFQLGAKAGNPRMQSILITFMTVFMKEMTSNPEYLAGRRALQKGMPVIHSQSAGVLKSVYCPTTFALIDDIKTFRKNNPHPHPPPPQTSTFLLASSRSSDAPIRYSAKSRLSKKTSTFATPVDVDDDQRNNHQNINNNNYDDDDYDMAVDCIDIDDFNENDEIEEEEEDTLETLFEKEKQVQKHAIDLVNKKRLVNKVNNKQAVSNYIFNIQSSDELKHYYTCLRAEAQKDFSDALLHAASAIQRGEAEIKSNATKAEQKAKRPPSDTRGCIGTPNHPVAFPSCLTMPAFAIVEKKKAKPVKEKSTTKSKATSKKRRKPVDDDLIDVDLDLDLDNENENENDNKTITTTTITTSIVPCGVKKPDGNQQQQQQIQNPFANKNTAASLSSSSNVEKKQSRKKRKLNIMDTSSHAFEQSDNPSTTPKIKNSELDRKIEKAMDYFMFLSSSSSSSSSSGNKDNHKNDVESNLSSVDDKISPLSSPPLPASPAQTVTITEIETNKCLSSTETSQERHCETNTLAIQNVENSSS